ncbi:hypothetical protein QQZ08_010844 [Neonectria magnoliae]|uniref:Apple domain-containing protein n=1 Tax=Neonectria magnoliae TaxID=2732573 RepID=A0ABR1HEQ4_9HYPO
MRSAIAFVALALAGAFDLVAAGPCKPSVIETTTGEIRTTGTSSGTSASTGSTTGASSDPSTTTSSPVVTNEVANGNFIAYDPGARNGIYAFNSEGNARLVRGDGYRGDGSEERGCVVMDSTSQDAKRQVTDWNAMIEQKLEDLDVANLYTVRFFYAVLDNAVADTCRINAYYGDDMFASTPYFPVTRDASNWQWLEFVNQAAMRTASGMIRFALACSGGSAQIYIDQVFVSDKVTPDNVDTISLFYESARTATVQTTESVATPPTPSFITLTRSDDTSPASTVDTAIPTGDEASTTPISATFLPTASGDETTFPTPFSTADVTTSQPCTTGYVLDTGNSEFACNSFGLYRLAYEADRTAFPNQKTPEDCAAICSDISTCKASTYRSRYDKCEFSDELLTDDNFSYHESGSYWSERRCWTRGCLGMATSAPTSTPTSTACSETGYVVEADSSYVCDSFGLYRLAYEADRTAFPKQKTSEDCAAICSQINTCKASTYRAQYDKCEFSDEPLTDDNFFYHESGSIWNEQRCWNPSGCLGSTATESTPTSTQSCSETGYVIEADSSYACNSFGLYRLAYEADRTSFPKQKSSEDCAAICSQINTCKASTYRSQYDKCEFSDEYLNDDNFFYHESGSVWNEQRCWNPSGCLDGRTTSAPSTPTSTPTSTSTSASCTQAGYVIEENADSSYSCNKFGLYRLAYEADRTSFPKQKTSQDCAAVCSQINTCKASTYNARYDLCLFSDEYVDADNFFYHSTGTYWSEQRCWDPSGCLDATTTTPSSTQSTQACTTGFAVPTDVDPSYTCNSFGLYRLAYQADQGSFPNQKTAVDCAAICARIRDCKASTYRSQYDVCEFSNEYLDAENFFYHETGSYWYEQRCWDPEACVGS